MSRTATRRLLALSPFSAREAPRTFLGLRAFSSTPLTRANEPAAHPSLNANDALFGLAKSTASGAQSKSVSDLASVFEESQPSRTFAPRVSRQSTFGSDISAADRIEEPHHFHVLSHKHNCHITLTNPNRDPLISLSCGNLGFKKSQRKHYDSAFQLAKYVLDRMREMGLNNQIKKMEVSLRGFGQGREAVTKALLGVEGRHIRPKIVKVSDATRLKFGGTRSRKMRRLG